MILSRSVGGGIGGGIWSIPSEEILWPLFTYDISGHFNHLPNLSFREPLPCIKFLIEFIDVTQVRIFPDQFGNWS